MRTADRGQLQAGRPTARAAPDRRRATPPAVGASPGRKRDRWPGSPRHGGGRRSGPSLSPRGRTCPRCTWPSHRPTRGSGTSGRRSGPSIAHPSPRWDAAWARRRRAGSSMANPPAGARAAFTGRPYRFTANEPAAVSRRYTLLCPSHPSAASRSRPRTSPSANAAATASSRPAGSSDPLAVCTTPIIATVSDPSARESAAAEITRMSGRT